MLSDPDNAAQIRSPAVVERRVADSGRDILDKPYIAPLQVSSETY